MDFYEKCEIQDEFYSGISSPAHRADLFVTKAGRCPSCGRDTSLPNLPHPSASKPFADLQNTPRRHDICVQCGGLGAGLLDGLSTINKR